MTENTIAAIIGGMVGGLTGGLFGIAGTLIGVYWGNIKSRQTSLESISASNKNAIDIMRRENFNTAAAKLRAAFAPAQSKIITEFYADGRKLRDFFYEEISIHAAAIEEFRPFVSDNIAYQKAWDDYQKTINHERGTNNEEYLWTSNVFETEEGIIPPNFTGAIIDKIEKILHIASPN